MRPRGRKTELVGREQHKYESLPELDSLFQDTCERVKRKSLGDVSHSMWYLLACNPVGQPTREKLQVIRHSCIRAAYIFLVI